MHPAMRQTTAAAPPDEDHSTGGRHSGSADACGTAPGVTGSGRVSSLEESVTGAQSLSPSQLVARVRASGLKTPGESASFVRSGRDAR